MVEELAGEPQPTIRAAEFFAGIGLVREALEPLGVEVVWANDIERAKRDAYAANHEATHFQLADVRKVAATDLPPNIDLATSSFPCVDLSLAGNRRGLVGSQSGMFWEFARVLQEMQEQRPRVVLLENVQGFATSHGGKDLTDALVRLSELGYSCDVFAVDARHFVPQSRPRMFIVGIRSDLPPQARTGIPPISDARPPWVQRVHTAHEHLRMHYLPLPDLPQGPQDLSSVIEKMDEADPRWWTHDRVAAFVESLSPVQTARMEVLRDARNISWRTAYRRTRRGVAVWELRRDAIGGCLRTTGGGSSKQALVEIGKGVVQVRWMTPLEYARMMGAGSYKLNGGTPNQALFGFGDAVVVDVIRWIGQHYLIPALLWQKVPQAT
ncbi:DNA cytosine methyltransferase [Micromonospora craniellae]|uniref:DNA cytosine methyltransferase n=1 Tax=Micromonospora craniellae TaxID=2294034 RepID=UPI001CC6B685|nr:DNA (cytosine-5-)-methyltransferase [Micromonospora craniellae]